MAVDHWGDSSPLLVGVKFTPFVPGRGPTRKPKIFVGSSTPGAIAGLQWFVLVAISRPSWAQEHTLQSSGMKPVKPGKHGVDVGSCQNTVDNEGKYTSNWTNIYSDEYFKFTLFFWGGSACSNAFFVLYV